MSNFDDAIHKMQQQVLNNRKPHALMCPHCHEQRLDRLRPLASGVVYCTSCSAEFEVKEP